MLHSTVVLLLSFSQETEQLKKRFRVEHVSSLCSRYFPWHSQRYRLKSQSQKGIVPFLSDYGSHSVVLSSRSQIYHFCFSGFMVCGVGVGVNFLEQEEMCIQLIIFYKQITKETWFIVQIANRGTQQFSI